jgi:hypothetical protein
MRWLVGVAIPVSMGFEACAQDVKSCSGLRTFCIQGVTRRHGDLQFRENAFRICMETGVWKTRGKYGRTVSQAIRR